MVDVYEVIVRMETNDPMVKNEIALAELKQQVALEEDRRKQLIIQNMNAIKELDRLRHDAIRIRSSNSIASKILRRVLNAKTAISRAEESLRKHFGAEE